MRIAGLLMLLCFVVAMHSVKAQTKNTKRIGISSPIKIDNSRLKSVEKAVRTISAGIINGKAINLVKPEYEKTARAIKAYGQVKVQVLVDENGNGVSAKALSGHVLLHPSVIKAALQSKFEPVILSGEAVRVNGIIYYNFIPAEWNWLEIGYTLNNDSDYYTIKTLSETMPSGEEEGRQLLIQWLAANENQDQIIETVIASLRGKLSDNAKAIWFFEVGLSLARVKQEWNLGEHTLNKNSQSFENLKLLSQNSPEVNEMLLDEVKKFIFFVDKGETTQVFSVLRNLEEKFPYVGK